MPYTNFSPEVSHYSPQQATQTSPVSTLTNHFTYIIHKNIISNKVDLWRSKGHSYILHHLLPAGSEETQRLPNTHDGRA